jgi:hypothetical protein
MKNYPKTIGNLTGCRIDSKKTVVADLYPLHAKHREDAGGAEAARRLESGLLPLAD